MPGGGAKGVDTAAFSGSGSTAITLNINPNLAALSFSKSNYTLSGGTLTMQQGTSGSGTSSMTVSGGSQTIQSSTTVQISEGSLAVAISGSGVLTIDGHITDDNQKEALTLSSPDGTGQLILGGANTYGGGTNVLSGTLVVQSPAGLLAGSNLNVGADAAAIFGSPMEGGAVVPAPVPEPGSVALLLAALGGVAIYGRFRRRFQ